MSMTDPCNVAGTNPSQAMCAASGKQKDSNMCNIMNSGVTVTTCSAQVQSAASDAASMGIGIAKLIGYGLLIIIVLWIVIAVFMKMTGAGDATYTGAGRFGKFNLLRKLFHGKR